VAVQRSDFAMQLNENVWIASGEGISMITDRRGLFVSLFAAIIGVFAYASSVLWQSAQSALGQSAQKAFSDCRRSQEDPTVKVLACTVVIDNVEKSFIERAYNSRGLAYMALKQYQKAISDFSAAITYDRQNSGYVDNRQGAYFALGDYKKALDDAELAVKIDPSAAFVYRSRGAIFNEIGQYEKAINDFSTAFKLDPSWVNLLIYRAISFRKLGRMESALEDLDQAIKLDMRSGG
jgi:tetratricopeptide (TPR) repeat protein